tara:strand:- start:258 stop:554 length:297 start_codon:yes stop_codon:yes gene_type:complete
MRFDIVYENVVFDKSNLEATAENSKLVNGILASDSLAEICEKFKENIFSEINKEKFTLGEMRKVYDAWYVVDENNDEKTKGVAKYVVNLFSRLGRETI